MQRNDNILEKDYVLITQWNRKTRNNTCQNIQQFCCTVKFVSLVNETKEALINGFSYHFTARNKL